MSGLADLRLPIRTAADYSMLQHANARNARSFARVRTDGCPHVMRLTIFGLQSRILHQAWRN